MNSGQSKDMSSAMRGLNARKHVLGLFGENKI